MLQNYKVDITDFISISSKGVKVADFVQVKEAIISKYKEVYGNDIDLSTGTADGVFVNNLSLIINNILQSFKILYGNLDVNTASGSYLDALCALSNITRKQATNSTASIIVNNSSEAAIEENNPQFVDKSGMIWNYNGILSLDKQEQKSIIVTCSELGAIEAPINWINQMLGNTSVIVTQNEAAIVGLLQETDTELKARRNQSAGTVAVTVLDSLIGALLNIAGIRDAYIYDNKDQDPYIAKDNTEIDLHSIYVIVRQEENVTIDDSIIGSIIFEKLTPGINTSGVSNFDNTKTYNARDLVVYLNKVYRAKASVSAGEFNANDWTELGYYNGESKSYDYTQSEKVQESTNTVKWKKAIPVSPQIVITLNTMNNFYDNETKSIINDTIEYLNNLSISTNLTIDDLITNISILDPRPNGKQSFTINNITINGKNETYINGDTYYKYDITKSKYDATNKTITLAG